MENQKHALEEVFCRDSNLGNHANKASRKYGANGPGYIAERFDIFIFFNYDDPQLNPSI